MMLIIFILFFDTSVPYHEHRLLRRKHFIVR